MREWFTTHWPKVLGTGVGGGGLFAIIFRDGIKDIIADWKKERQEQRAERLAERGKGDQLAGQLLSALRDDLKLQREHDSRVVLVLEGVRDVLVRLEGKADGQGKQMDMVHQRVISIQGAVSRTQ